MAWLLHIILFTTMRYVKANRNHHVFEFRPGSFPNPCQPSPMCLSLSLFSHNEGNKYGPTPFQNLLNVQYFTKIRGIIQNACYCLFSTDLNKIFHITCLHIVHKKMVALYFTVMFLMYILCTYYSNYSN